MPKFTINIFNTTPSLWCHPEVPSSIVPIDAVTLRDLLQLHCANLMHYFQSHPECPSAKSSTQSLRAFTHIKSSVVEVARSINFSDYTSLAQRADYLVGHTDTLPISPQAPGQVLTSPPSQLVERFLSHGGCFTLSSYLTRLDCYLKRQYVHGPPLVPRGNTCVQDHLILPTPASSDFQQTGSSFFIHISATDNKSLAEGNT